MPTAPDEPFAGRISRARHSIISSALIVFTLLVALLCVLLLSCTLTQTRLGSIAVNGVNISIWKLDYIRVQWSDIRQQLGTELCTLALAEEKERAASEANAEFDVKYQPERTAFDAKMEPLVDAITKVDPVLAGSLKDRGPVERLEGITAYQKALTDKAPELKPLIDDVLQRSPHYRQTDAERIEVRDKLKAAKGMVATLTENVNATKASLDDIFATQIGAKQLDDATRERVENAMYELYSGGKYGTSCGGSAPGDRSSGAAAVRTGRSFGLRDLTNYILLMSPDVLTLALVIAMGVLGSALQMTHALFKYDELDRVGAYFLRLCVGAITALVIFIVSKAGIPLVADTSRMAGETPINPYFVSFLAIISGLMSENAIISVQNQATKLFGTDAPPEPERWARTDLQPAFELSQRDPERVRLLLAADPKEFDDWISGKAPIPASAQTLIAGVLGASPRDLFTDLPPEPVKTT